MLNLGIEHNIAETGMAPTLGKGSELRTQPPCDGRSARLLIRESVSADSSSTWPQATPHLEAWGYSIHRAGSDNEALEALRQGRADLLIVANPLGEPAGGEEGPAPGSLRAVARELGIPVLEVVESFGTLCTAASQPGEADDWVQRTSTPEELAARVERLLRGGKRSAAAAPAARGQGLPVDSRFTALVVHDLRTPLNVIGLSFRMIEQVLPRDDPDVAEDLRFIDENFRQLERMLSQLGDYSRLFEPGLKLSVSAFSPRRLVDELLENRDARCGGKPPVQVVIEKSCPAEAALDQARARLAIEYALANASAAAQGDPVRLTLQGQPERWIITIQIDRPPPSSVHSTELRPHVFERICGSSAERRGMDLAIVARVSELFDGTVRLEAVEERSTCLILDWPVRITDPAGLA